MVISETVFPYFNNKFNNSLQHTVHILLLFIHNGNKCNRRSIGPIVTCFCIDQFATFSVILCDHRRKFGLKSGGVQARRAIGPRIETPKASRGTEEWGGNTPH